MLNDSGAWIVFLSRRLALIGYAESASPLANWLQSGKLRHCAWPMLRPVDALDNTNADAIVDAVDAVAANDEAVANEIADADADVYVVADADYAAANEEVAAGAICVAADKKVASDTACLIMPSLDVGADEDAVADAISSAATNAHADAIMRVNMDADAKPFISPSGQWSVFLAQECRNLEVQIFDSEKRINNQLILDQTAR